MTIENNFVYPFSGTMYDPILKIRVAIESNKEMYREEDGTIAIYYNRNIRSDNLIAPRADEELEFSRKFRAPGTPLYAVKPLQDGEKCVANVIYTWKKSGRIIRITTFPMKSYFRDISRIFRMIAPEVDRNASDVIFYAIENYVNLPSLRLRCFPAEKYPDIDAIEIGVPIDELINVFEMSPDQYREVEPGIFCVASRTFSA